MTGFLRRRYVVILFVIYLIGAGLTYHRQERLIEDNRANAERIVEQAAEYQKALCESRIESRANLRALLLSIVQDYLPDGRPARAVLERRIEDYLGPPPEDCQQVPGA